MKDKKTRMLYKGPSRDISYNPWLRLIHGKRYDVEVHKMKSGKYRLTVTDEFDRARISYKDRSEMKKEWE